MVLNVGRKLLRLSETSTDFGLPMGNRNKSQHFTLNSCFNVLHSAFSRIFYKIGYTVGKYPSYFLIIPFFISTLGLSGFQRIEYERDSEYLFVPTSAESKIASQTLEDLFPYNSSQLFDPSRISNGKYLAKLYISAKDGGTMFRRKVWKEVILLDQLIQNITVEWDGKEYKYPELCAKWQSDCYFNNIYNLNDIIPDLEDQQKWISYPINLFPFLLPMFFGGIKVNESDGVLESSKAVFTTYWLAKDDWKERKRAHIWEGKLLQFLEDTDFESIVVDRYTSRSIPDELQKNNEELRSYLPYALLLLFGFSVISVLSCDWVRCKVQLVLMGIVTVILAVCTSFGLLMYIGVAFIGINTAAPFLLLGIGLDDMFIMLSAWRRTKLQDEVPKRLAETYKATAVSITVTSLTNILAFSVGTLTSFPGVKIFCIYLGVSVAITYLWFLTFFGACLTMFAHLEKRQRHSLICWKVKSKSESSNLGWCYKAFCAGGISKSDPWNPEDNLPCRLSIAIKNRLGPLLSNKGVKGGVLILYLLYLSGAIYGCFHVQEGLNPKSLAVDNSYLARFYDTENNYFKRYPYRIQVIVRGNLSYYEKETKVQIIKLHKAMENLTCIGSRLYSSSWLRGFLAFLTKNKDLKNNITDEQSFIDILDTKFMKPYRKESLDVAFNENKTKILASRFIIQGYNVQGLEEDKKMIRALRKVAEDSPLDVLVYHPSFVYYDQYLMIMRTTVRALAVAAFIMMVVSFLFIPNPLSSMWVGISILSIQVGVIGYAALWSVRLDTISMINHIMSIGYSVDFSAHIVYAYLTSKQQTSEEKLKESLYTMALPIIQSGLSTILGVVLFILVPSYIYRTFFKIIFLVTLFGMMHALLVLPTLLSLTPLGSCKIKSKNETNQDGGGSNELEPKPKFTTCPTDELKEDKIQITLHQTDSCFQPSSLSRESSVSGSKSAQSESLRLSDGSLEQTLEPETIEKKL